MNKETFLNKLDRIPDLPTLPVVAMKVNKLLQNDDVSTNMISTAIEKDPSMVSKILKLVNSAFYGFGSKINTISHAVTILGFNTVRNAVISVAVIDAFSGVNKVADFDITQFWKHSVAVAVTGRRLAEKSRLTMPDQAFVVGILHDVGKLVLIQYFTELFIQAWTYMRDNNSTFCEAEKEILPVGHAQIGGRLAKKWRLPAGLVEGLAYHHHFNESVIGPDLVMVVHVADYIVNRYSTDKSDFDVSGIHPKAAKTLKPQLGTLPEWFPGVETEIEAACRFFFQQ